MLDEKEKETEEGVTAESTEGAGASSGVGVGGGGDAGGSSRSGLLGASFRPAFLRSFSRGAAPSGDVESQTATQAQA